MHPVWAGPSVGSHAVNWESGRIMPLTRPETANTLWRPRVAAKLTIT